MNRTVRIVGAREDRAHLDQLRDQCARMGLTGSVYYDTPPSNDPATSDAEGLSYADMAVLLLTDAFLLSPFCHAELAYALAEVRCGRFPMPVLLVDRSSTDGGSPCDALASVRRNKAFLHVVRWRSGALPSADISASLHWLATNSRVESPAEWSSRTIPRLSSPLRTLPVAYLPLQRCALAVLGEDAYRQWSERIRVSPDDEPEAEAALLRASRDGKDGGRLAAYLPTLHRTTGKGQERMRAPISHILDGSPPSDLMMPHLLRLGVLTKWRVALMEVHRIALAELRRVRGPVVAADARWIDSSGVDGQWGPPDGTGWRRESRIGAGGVVISEGFTFQGKWCGARVTADFRSFRLRREDVSPTDGTATELYECGPFGSGTRYWLTHTSFLPDLEFERSLGWSPQLFLHSVSEESPG